MHTEELQEHERKENELLDINLFKFNFFYLFVVTLLQIKMNWNLF